MIEIKCTYLNQDMEEKDIKFDDYGVFGKWVADNAEEVLIISVLQEEE